MSKKAKSISTYVVIALGASVVLGGIFTVLAMNTFSKVDVIVAAQDIEPYSGVLTAEHFRTIEVAKGDKENFAMFEKDINALVGKVATSSIFSGQPVKSVQFVNPDDAKGLQSVVNENNRALYLPMQSAYALMGDMKIGGKYDFYFIVEHEKPMPGKEDYKEKVIVPLQSSFAVKKMLADEDGNVSVLMEFPKEESERYVMLQHLIMDGKAILVATMPNSMHELYEANILTSTDFTGAIMSDKEYFTSISRLEDIEGNVDVDTENTLEQTEPSVTE